MSKNLTTRQRDELAGIRRFDQLVRYLRDELDWPIQSDSFEDLTFEYTPEELGIDRKNAAKIQEIKRLRPLSAGQPWGIFFVKFEPRKLPVVALRRILGSVALKKRASANSAERQAWAADDLLFVSNYGEGAERQISFAHFTPAANASDLPTLKVLGWDQQDTALHLDAVADTLHSSLAWPDDESDLTGWRDQWRAAFRLRHQEVITTSKDLSVRLAELARNIRDQIGKVLAVESDKGPFRQLLEGFRQSLVADLDEKGFADMYAQTISYGLLSARIVDPKHRTADDFAAHMRTSPFLRELMENFIRIGGRKKAGKGPQIDFDELGVSEVVELLDQANMEAVVRDFGREKRDEDPVIHFYENFLTEYDKQEKVSRGVFYTPKPVVSYIVRSVDELLRTEFDLEDGLADTTTWGEMAERNESLEIPEGAEADDPFVCILDPATGTGTFLVEVIEVIHATMMAKWRSEGVRSEKALLDRWNEYVPKHLLPRLHGYELMMAPYAIAHLKIGLKLLETGYRFESEERARIYLTNALEPAQVMSGKFEFAIPALAHEAEEVNAIKTDHRFTVIVGNPPYSNFGQLNRLPFILELLGAYKKGLGERKINLDDDYIKFIRLSHYMVEQSGAGIIGLITNNSYLDGITHRQMRKSLKETFDPINILNLHGSAVLREVSPDGSLDENVFDIRQGVGISLLSKKNRDNNETNALQYVDFWGSREEKYIALNRQSYRNLTSSRIQASEPYFFFTPKDFGHREEYESYMPLREVFDTDNTGIQTKRDRLTIHMERSSLKQALSDVINLQDTELRARYNLPADGRDWQVKLAKQDIGEVVDDSQIVQILYRPFDWRWTYFTGRTRGFLAYPRRETMQNMLVPNQALVTIRINGGGRDFVAMCADCLVEKGSLPRGNYSVFPLYIYPSLSEGPKQFSIEGQRRLNLTAKFKRRLSERLIMPPKEPDDLPAGISGEQIFDYMYAIFHSQVYRERYSEMLKVDFPRVALPRDADVFSAVAAIGYKLVSLHLFHGKPKTAQSPDFIGTAKSEVSRVGWSDDTVWLDAGKTNARDRYRATKAGTIGFQGVPEEVWDFHIGGYQVCHKWLKDRKGRTLSDDDIAHYQKIIVALSETIRIMAEIDEVIEAHGGWPGAFQTKEASEGEGEPEAEQWLQAAESKGRYGKED